MNYSRIPPPNYETIKQCLPHADFYRGAVFTYGDTCHSQDPLVPWLVPHEQVHVRQQGDDPEGWWTRYLSDKEFRLQQELEAYQTEYQFVKANIRGQNQLFGFLESMARDLSSAQYGHIIGFYQAIQRIRR